MITSTNKWHTNSCTTKACGDTTVSVLIGETTHIYIQPSESHSYLCEIVLRETECCTWSENVPHCLQPTLDSCPTYTHRKITMLYTSDLPDLPITSQQQQQHSNACAAGTSWSMVANNSTELEESVSRYLWCFHGLSFRDIVYTQQALCWRVTRPLRSSISSYSRIFLWWPCLWLLHPQRSFGELKHTGLPSFEYDCLISIENRVYFIWCPSWHCHIKYKLLFTCHNLMYLLQRMYI